MPLLSQGRDQFLDMNRLAIPRCDAMMEQYAHRRRNFPLAAVTEYKSWIYLLTAAH
jgi:hypothetical protein